MPTAQLPRGSNLELSIKKQSAFKSPAAGNYLRTVAYSYAMNEARPLQDNPILGGLKHNTRDATAATQGVSTHSGQIEVPLDFSHVRYWLELALGAPVTSQPDSGDPDFVHVFSSGLAVLPEATIERRMAKSSGAMFIQDVGVMVNGFSLQVSRQGGIQRVSLDCVGYGQNSLSVTAAGTPVSPVTEEPILAALGVYKKGGVALGRVLSFDLNYSNNLGAREEIGDWRVAGFDPDVASLTASMRVRLTDATLFDEAIANTPHEGELLFEKSATRALSFVMPTLRPERPPVPNEGPGFLDVTYSLRGEQTSDEPMLTATLKNGVESF
jgi:hypothetical protein